MDEIYSKLNQYLSEICNYLEKDNSFLLDNILRISILNSHFLNRTQNETFGYEIIHNHLTFEDVFLLAREIIESIDKSYLTDFDKLISTGEIDFSFEDEYIESKCVTFYKNKNEAQQMININRSFNYDDCLDLVHEFIHYTNGKTYTENRHLFTEFISIYYELYAEDFLLKKGINKKELNIFGRMKSLKYHSKMFFNYEVVLVAYLTFGPIQKDTLPYLKKYILNMTQEDFDDECTLFYKNLAMIEKNNKEKLDKNPSLLGKYLSEKFITHNYRYILGTFLAIYARKYVDPKNILYLNQHLADYPTQSVVEICKSIGIDLNSENFSNELFLAIDEYVDELKQINTKNR